MKLANADAALAYANALQRAQLDPGGPGDIGSSEVTGPGFADLVRDVVEQSSENLVAGEKATVERLTSDTEIIDIVAAVTNAEVTLETVVVVRDRVIKAYQDIIQMPI
ncbi:MAG: flagellar hook-basal body complex protein FliE [Sphingomonadales bacterium]